MRELFLPEDDCVWGSFDYSQQEPRIVVHYAIKLGLNQLDEFDKEDAQRFSRLLLTWQKYLEHKPRQLT